jgi:hypothetical protein
LPDGSWCRFIAENIIVRFEKVDVEKSSFSLSFANIAVGLSLATIDGTFSLSFANIAVGFSLATIDGPFSLSFANVAVGFSLPTVDGTFC